MTDEDTRLAILKEIDELAGRPVLQPGDITVQDLEKQWGITGGAVQKRMRPLVEAGKFERLKVYKASSGRSCIVYRKPEKETTSEQQDENDIA